MTAQLERPDPYKLKPRPKSGRSKAAGLAQAPKLSERHAQLQDALKAMLYENMDEAHERLTALTSEEALASGDPVAIDALAFLSSARWGLGRAELAIEASDRALELGPTRFAPNQKAGEMALRLGNSELAATRFLAALRASEPGTQDAKAAEASLREARRRTAKGIRHEAKSPRLTAWMTRLLPRRRQDQPAEPVIAG